jgi:ABC-type transport system substrate-binding protein
MVRHWLKKPNLVIYLPVILILVAAVACQTAAQPTEAPTATTAPTPTMAAADPTAVPTAEAQATQLPGDGMMAGPKYAPPFAEYWKPPTDFYGQPVYGGTLRVNYEDPLAHANVWGAWAGYAVRLRAPTMNGLLMEDPYDAYGPFIPDLAHGWTVHDDSQGVTFFLREGVKWHNGAELICEDARFTIETLITVKGLTSSYLKSRLTNVDLNALECEDDLTLKVRFTSPTPTPLLALSSYSALVFNKEWFEAGGEDAMFQDVSVGTGAFKWAPGQEVGVDT